MEEHADEKNADVLQIVAEDDELELEPQDEMEGFGYERFVNMTDGRLQSWQITMTRLLRIIC